MSLAFDEAVNQSRRRRYCPLKDNSRSPWVDLHLAIIQHRQTICIKLCNANCSAFNYPKHSCLIEAREEIASSFLDSPWRHSNAPHGRLQSASLPSLPFAFLINSIFKRFAYTSCEMATWRCAQQQPRPMFAFSWSFSFRLAFAF